MLSVEDYGVIRRAYRDGMGIRAIARQFHHSRRNVREALASPEPQPYTRVKDADAPKLGAFKPTIDQILVEDELAPPKQRHTAKTIWRELEKEGFTGRYTIVKDAVRELKDLGQEVFMPLAHRPGEAQVDFGYALVKMAGILRKVAFFAMALPHSDAFFVMAFERECTETFWEGHVRAFEFFAGVLWRITYVVAQRIVRGLVGI